MIRLNNVILTSNSVDNAVLLDAILDTTGDRASFDVDMGEVQFDAEDCREAADFFNGLAFYLDSFQ